MLKASGDKIKTLTFGIKESKISMQTALNNQECETIKDRSDDDDY